MRFIRDFFTKLVSKDTTGIPDLSALQREIGYRFKDPNFLIQAMTHPSYCAEHPEAGNSNQRLEFLGDGVLEQIVNEALFHQFPADDEGLLTRKKATLVQDKTLSEVGRQIHLGQYLRLGVGELRSGGDQRRSNLADALEALIGAIYLDGGFPAARDFVTRYLLSKLDHFSGLQTSNDYKSLLQIEIQRQSDEQPSYQVVAESGPPHDKTFSVEVLVAARVIGKGSGRSKKDAEKMAAKTALENLAKNPQLLKLTNGV